MGPKRDHTSNEKSIIVSELGNGKTTIEISEILGRDHRTVKKFVQSPISGRRTEDKDYSREDKGNSREDKGNSRVASNRCEKGSCAEPMSDK